MAANNKLDVPPAEGENQIRDVRSMNSEETIIEKEKGDKEEAAYNDAMQEANKRSQRNGEIQSKYGDSSGPEKSKFAKK